MVYNGGKKEPRADNRNCERREYDKNRVNLLLLNFLSKKDNIIGNKRAPTMIPQIPKSYNSTILLEPKDPPFR